LSMSSATVFHRRK